MADAYDRNAEDHVTPSRPAERYGRLARPTPSRRVLIGLAAVAVLAGLVVAYEGYRNLGDPPITGQVIAFTSADDHVDVRLAVHRDHPDRAATCVVRARSRDGVQVGQETVPVPAGGGQDQAYAVTVRTSDRPVVADALSCGYVP